MARTLRVDDLLAGAARTHTVRVPAELLGSEDGLDGEVELRPLTLRDVQRIRKAARDQRALTSVLMVREALVAPELTIEQAGRLTAGLVQFLLERINRISGLTLEGDELEDAVRAPLARACFILARDFGWTPSECAALTVGQVLLYLEMLARDGAEEAT